VMLDVLEMRSHILRAGGVIGHGSLVRLPGDVYGFATW
jgi:hypothetical protein